ncbi:MAG: YdcF family protein [Magnetococcales bacterium]|nr:YdcF family protein [Magnetococcales bacterium]
MIALWVKYQLAGVANPLTAGLLILIGIIVLYTRRPVMAKRLGLGVILILWSLSSRQVADWIATPLELAYPPRPITDLPAADAIIILGGAVKEPDPPRLEIELTEASDRVLHGFRLFHAGKAPLIIASGGGETRPEAKSIARLLRLWGVPATAIIEEVTSLSTRENAIETEKIMTHLNLRRGLLVTSALHMPRAVGAFRALNVDITPATTDINLSARPERPQAWFNHLPNLLPNPEALSATNQALREWAALKLYGYRGWLRTGEGNGNNTPPTPPHPASLPGEKSG